MRWMMLMLLLTSCAAMAQDKQIVPLRYELWWDERSFWFIGKELTTPGNAKLPPLNNPKFFSSKFADSERLFAVAEEEGELILVADTDGDNDLTDEKVFRLRQRGYHRVFGPIPMKIRVNGKIVVRHIGVRVDREEDGSLTPYLIVASRWKGTVQWDGKSVPVTILDANADGLVNKDDFLFLGDEFEGRRLPVSGRLGIEGRFFRFHVPPTGEHLVIEPIQVKSATVQVRGDEASLTLEDNDGRWTLDGRNGKVSAPAGEFRLLEVTVSRKDSQGRNWVLTAAAYGPAAPRLNVSEHGASLEIEPLKVELIYNRKGDEVEFSLDIKTANGMSLRGLTVDNRLPPEPKLQLKALNGEVIAEPQFHYG
mgnify:CR=1 FL=1